MVFESSKGHGRGIMWKGNKDCIGTEGENLGGRRVQRVLCSTTVTGTPTNGYDPTKAEAVRGKYSEEIGDTHHRMA